ncbi:MAG: hypothetical protein ACOCTN_04000 [Candidatus Natronoplasma sp.]
MNRKTGYIILAVGLALLLFTFYLAIQAFLGAEYIQNFEDLVVTNREGVAALVDVLIYVIPILLLVVMASIGGKVMHYGIKLIRTPDPKTLDEKREEEKTAPPKRVKRTTSPKNKTPPPPPKTDQTKGGEKETPEPPEPPEPQSPSETEQ